MDGLLVPCIYCVQAFHSNYYRLGKLPYGIPVHVRELSKLFPVVAISV